MLQYKEGIYYQQAEMTQMIDSPELVGWAEHGMPCSCVGSSSQGNRNIPFLGRKRNSFIVADHYILRSLFLHCPKFIHSFFLF